MGGFSNKMISRVHGYLLGIYFLWVYLHFRRPCPPHMQSFSFLLFLGRVREFLLENNFLILGEFLPGEQQTDFKLNSKLFT